MDLLRKYRSRSLGSIVVCSLVLAAVVSGAGYYGLDLFFKRWTVQDALASIYNYAPEAMEYIELGFANYYNWVIPGIFALFFITGVILWLVLLICVAPVLKSEDKDLEPVPSKTGGKKDFLDHKIEQERKRRLFLHTLSVLQREGRLLDFFDEDLSLYEDEQIGAAVRSIQHDCKKAVKKYIDLKPVVSGEEGDAITIEEGFDMDAIHLVGNVAGQPPFEGIIKHPGWKAGKKDVPKLSDIQEPGIITPAEIEIQ